MGASKENLKAVMVQLPIIYKTNLKTGLFMGKHYFKYLCQIKMVGSLTPIIKLSLHIHRTNI
jgi:hypothetical protein